MPRGEQFLDKKYKDLRTSEPVKYEQRRRRRHGEKEPKKPHEKIGDFLDVIKRTHGHHDDPRVLERIKQSYHKKHVIIPEEIPESYFDNQQRLAREQGHGDIEITDEMREHLTEVVIADQKSSLDNWVEYLSSTDADAYPTWAKYWAFQSMLKLSSYDKEKHAFGKRRKGTVAPFPDLNREALAYVVDMIEKKVEKKETEELEEDNEELKKLLQTERFGKLYAYAIEKVTPAEEVELKDTRGEWVIYSQNSDHMPLVASLQGHGTGWCTAGESTARTQLDTGDFHVYYSFDKDGNPTVPRAAIRMEEDRIAEVRGIAHEQNLDPNIAPVVEQKLQKFGTEGEVYKKKSADMKRLTKIEKKMKQGKDFTTKELVFLYEIDIQIEGFGYDRDPRIEEMKNKRNSEEDMPVVFECTPDQIAHTIKDIGAETKVYVGPLEKGIFTRIAKHNIEHVYTEFPEGRIRRRTIEMGGKDKDEIIDEFDAKGLKISYCAKIMMDNPDFTTAKQKVSIDTVTLQVKDLGFTTSPTTDELYKRAQELGLELCPAETGPHYRLQYPDQPQRESHCIGMKQTTGSNGDSYVFCVEAHENELWLREAHPISKGRWPRGVRFVFRFRK